MVKTITLKLDEKSENVGLMLENIAKLYKEEIKSFKVKDEKEIY